MSKCEFWTNHVKFLRHVVSQDDIALDPEKVKAILNWEALKNVFEIKIFLSLAGYYRRFVQGFPSLVAPLTRLTKKEVTFTWSPEC